MADALYSSSATVPRGDEISRFTIGKPFLAIDGAIDENLTISQFELVGKAVGDDYWLEYDDAAVTPHTEIGIALQAATSGAGEHPKISILREGQVDMAVLVGLPAAYKAGDYITGVNILLGTVVNADA